MAIAFTARANIGATSTTVTTASFTPTANSRLFAVGGARPSAGATPTITDSTGGVWTALPGSALKFGNVGGTFSYLNIGASPVAMTVTVTSAGSTQVGVQCFDATGGGTDMTNFKVNTNAAGDPSVTLDAVASGSYGIAAFVGNAGAAPTTTPVGYSSVYSSTVATNLRMNLYTDATSPGTAQAWTTSSTDSIAFGFEIKEPVAAGGTAGMKVWSGSAWVDKPVKAWTGSTWATKPVKHWDGSAWVGGSGAVSYPPYFDNFERPNAALEASAVASGGWSWIHDGLIAGALALNSHALRCTTTSSTGSAYKVPDLGSADHYVEYKVPSITTNAGSFACCRLADNNNFVGMRTDLATVEVWRRNAGTLTSLYTQPTGVAAGDVLRLEVSGLNYLVKKNGAILKASTAIGGTALTATTAGVVARTLVATPFDNFQAGV